MTVHVGIIGCGNIFPRHIEAIKSTGCVLEAVCDIDKDKADRYSKEFNTPAFYDYKEMLKMLPPKAMVTIAIPNSLHYQVALDCLNAGFHILVEKPVCLLSSQVREIVATADKVKRNAYAVLQVRHNPTIIPVQEALKAGLLGDIRAVSLVLRWQRPESYFNHWYADQAISGGVLYEVGVHYMDILGILFGVPEVLSARAFCNKYQGEFRDTVYAILKFKSGASGSLEVSIASEPQNLECSLSIMGSMGHIRIGGKALDVIETSLFSNTLLKGKWDELTKDMQKSLDPNSYGTHVGSCPNHPSVYKAIMESHGTKVKSAIPVIEFIENVYKEIK